MRTTGYIASLSGIACCVAIFVIAETAHDRHDQLYPWALHANVGLSCLGVLLFITGIALLRRTR